MWEVHNFGMPFAPYSIRVMLIPCALEPQSLKYPSTQVQADQS